MGVWIEIDYPMTSHATYAKSPPMWGCGLKLHILSCEPDWFTVTPYVGVWIEIILPQAPFDIALVTPYVGVWIEISSIVRVSLQCDVTPYVGVWIEIGGSSGDSSGGSCHPLCGGVD